MAGFKSSHFKFTTLYIMVFSFSQAILSYFFNLTPSPTMSGEGLLLDPNIYHRTNMFLYLIRTWASGSEDPQAITDRFDVVLITHFKKAQPTEHEYLLLKTKDREKDQTVYFVLERNASRQTTEPTVTTSDEKWKTMSATLERLASTALGSSQLASMEEGSSATNSPKVSDELTLLSIQTADILLDSIRSEVDSDAIDQFKFLPSGPSLQYHGEEVQYFKPNRLSLFEFTVLADVVHDAYPKYSILNSQCYFYAGLVYRAAEKYSKVALSEIADTSQMELVSMRGSHLSGKNGRRNGIMVTYINPESSVIYAIMARFKKALQENLAEVFFLNYLSN